MYGNFKYQQLKNVGISQEKALQMAAFVKVSSFEEGHVIWSKGSKIDAWRFIINGLVAPTPLAMEVRLLAAMLMPLPSF